MSKHQIAGFSLLELMVTVTIAAILMAIALPSFQSALRSNRVATTTNEILASLALARSEAVRNTRGAGACTSADGSVCGGDWNSGWLVWSDTNGNGALDAAEVVIRYTQGKDSVAMAGTATTIAFDPRGRVSGGQKTIDITPYGETAPARCVTVGVTGQARVAQVAC